MSEQERKAWLKVIEQAIIEKNKVELVRAFKKISERIG